MRGELKSPGSPSESVMNSTDRENRGNSLEGWGKKRGEVSTITGAENMLGVCKAGKGQDYGGYLGTPTVLLKQNREVLKGGGVKNQIPKEVSSTRCQMFVV